MNDFDYLAQLPGEEREQNWIRMRLGTLSVREGIVLAAAAQADPPENAVQAINQLQSLDEYAVCLNTGSYEALGRRYLLNDTKMPRDALPFLDLEAVGRQYEDRHPGLFIGNCYVQYPETPPKPVYQPGMALPADDGWSVKLKVASPNLPDGVWMRLPWETGLESYTFIEEEMTLNELQTKSWDECVLLDARCIYPEACDLMKQYSNMADLVNDSKTLGYLLSGNPYLGSVDLECCIAAMELEGCKNLKQALDICHNINCYDWVPCAQLEDHAKEALQKADISDNLIQSGAIDLRSYGAHLLETQGYTLSADKSGYIARNSQAFVYKYSPQPVSDSPSNDNVMGHGGCEQASDFSFLTQLPGTKQEQDWLKERLETLSVREGVVLAAAAMRNPPEDMVQAINCLQSLDGYEVHVGVGSYEALGQAYLRDKTNMPKDALPFADLEQRERQEEAMGQTEQLLRRMTGSITAYMDMVGQRPLRVNDYDKAVLAVRDGEMSTFKELCPRVLGEHTNELLIETAGRPGNAGGRMMALVLANKVRFTEDAYRAACQKAIDIADGDRALLLLVSADHYVDALSPSLHGEMASYAYMDHPSIAREIIRHCNEEQIAAAPPLLLELFAAEPDYGMLSTLVEKGISGGNSAERTLHMLTYEGRNSWIAEDLLEKRMWVDVNDYRALNACVENGAVNVAKLLLDGGMDFEQYRQRFPNSGSPDTIQALEEHWNELQAQSQESAGPEQGQTQEPEIGGMDLG